ncbi:MAG TPA: hypothetical protein VFU15_01045, partial [Bacteroidia bacterium]|nr:hypothetical protein [Bacteroidia bacterium]
TIHDAGRTGAAKITFDKTYPVPASDTMAPLLCSDTSKIALFTSGVSLDWQQTPRKRIELRKSGTTLIDDLPNPDQRKPGTTIYVYV